MSETTPIDDQIKKLADLPFPTQRWASADFVYKVISNIIKDPANQKYRVLKKANKKVIEACGEDGQCNTHQNVTRNLLTFAGFVPGDELWVCPPNAHMDTIVALHKKLVDYLPEDHPDLVAKRQREGKKTAEMNAMPIPGKHVGENAPASGTFAKPPPKAAASPAKPKPQPASASSGGYANRMENLNISANRSAASQPEKVSPAAASKKKSAFEFESRAKRDERAEARKKEMEDIRAERKKRFQTDDKTGDAYKQKPSVAPGGKEESSWWPFGGGSSGSDKPDKPDKPDRKGPNMKTMRDLPQQPRRGG